MGSLCRQPLCSVLCLLCLVTLTVAWLHIQLVLHKRSQSCLAVPRITLSQ